MLNLIKFSGRKIFASSYIPYKNVDKNDIIEAIKPIISLDYGFTGSLRIGGFYPEIRWNNVIISERSKILDSGIMEHIIESSCLPSSQYMMEIIGENQKTLFARSLSEFYNIHPTINEIINNFKGFHRIFVDGTEYRIIKMHRGFDND